AATIGVAVARGPSAVRRAAAPTARMRKGPGRPGRERRDQETHEANDSSFHDAAMPPQLGLDALAFVRGLTPGGSAGRSGRANGMGLAAALGEAKASAATVGSSCQLENSIWWRRCCGSAWNTARAIRGSLSSSARQERLKSEEVLLGSLY